MARFCGIYAIIHKMSGHWYIGQSIDVERRWHEEIRELNLGTFHNTHLLRAWKKYVQESFEFRLLFECSTERLTACEQAVFDLIRSCGIKCYNQGPFMDSPMKGRHWTAEERAQIGSRQLGRKHSAATRLSISSALMGHKHSSETRAKIGLTSAGRKHRPETRLQISSKLKGRIVSSDTRAKLSANWHTHHAKTS
jgi:group I intron endonuclease